MIRVLGSPYAVVLFSGPAASVNVIGQVSIREQSSQFPRNDRLVVV